MNAFQVTLGFLTLDPDCCKSVNTLVLILQTVLDIAAVTSYASASEQPFGSLLKKNRIMVH